MLGANASIHITLPSDKYVIENVFQLDIGDAEFSNTFDAI